MSFSISGVVMAVFVIILNTPCVHSFEPFSVNFQKTTFEDHSQKTIAGSAFLCSEHHAYLRVNTPVNQIMCMESNTLNIYYPDDDIAMRISTDHPFSIPLLQSFNSSFNEDFGLSDLGFELSRDSVKKDSLYTFWTPPKELEDIFGPFTVVYLADDIVLVRFHEKRKNSTHKIIFENYQSVNNISFPKKITLTEVIKDKEKVVSIIHYKNMKYDINIPEHICNFEFPDSTEVREIEW